MTLRQVLRRDYLHRGFLDNWNALVNWTNVAWQVFHLAIGGVLLVLLWVVLARVWGADRFGWFNYLYILITMGGLFANFGLDVLLTRSVAGGLHGIWLPLLRLKWVALLGGLVIFSVLAWSLPQGLRAPYFTLLVGVLIFSGTVFLNGLLRGLDRLDLEAKIGLFQKIVFVLSSLAGVWMQGYGLLWVGGCYLGSQVLTFGLTWIVIPQKSIIIKQASVDGSSSNCFTEAWPLFGISILTFLVLRIDIFFLQWLAGPEEVGVYAAAFRFLEGLVLMATAYLAALFPRLVAQIRLGAEWTSIVKRSFYLVFVGGVLSGLLLWCLAPYLTTLLLGPAFRSSQGLLRGLVMVVPVLFTTLLLGQVLIAQDRQRLYAGGLVAGTGVAGAVALLAIPGWGAWGAVVAVWAREICQFLFLVAVLKRRT